MHHRSVLFRLICTFSLALIPIVCVGVYINSLGWSMLSEQNAYSMSQQMQFNIETLENQLRLSEKQLSDLINEKDARRFCALYRYISSYEYVNLTNSIQEQLQTIVYSSDFLQGIQLYFPEQGLRIGATTSGSLTRRSRVEPKDYQDILRLAANWDRHIQPNDSGVFVNIQQWPSRLAIARDAVPRILGCAEYNMDKIQKYLSGVLPDVRPQCFLIEKNGRSLFGNDSPVLNEVIAHIDEKADLLYYGDVSENGTAYLSIGCYSEMLDAYYIILAGNAQVYVMPIELRNAMLVLLLCGVAALAVYIFFTVRDVYLPLKKLERGFERLSSGEMDFSIDVMGGAEFHELTKAFNTTLIRLKTAVTQLYIQKNMTQQAQLKQMQSQINPHFLYNSYYILNNMLLLEDYETAQLFSKRLGQYFRYVTRDARDIVTLREEYSHIESYLNVQQVRFGERLRVTLPPLPEALCGVYVPRLSLQPLIENAFVHSLEHMPYGGILDVAFERAQDKVYISVRNNGAADAVSRIAEIRASLAETAPSLERTGLKNVHERLLLLQNEGLTVQTEGSDIFVVIMPIHEKEMEERAVSDRDRG